MATTTGTPTRPAPRDEKVYHPLDTLKGIIRRYVVIEGVLSVLIFLLAWFTIALVLDYGIFKAFTWDWVQDGAWWLRLATLVLALTLLAGILVFRIVRRLTTEFSYPALALVLEKRYPKLLGDRLITAVELADVDDAAKYGYSKAMIRQTIEEARERVGKANVREAFNWRRLRIMGLIVVGSMAGLLFAGFLSHAIAAGQIQPIKAAWKSYHVASIVVERDVLLLDTPWPRRALLELVDVPDKGIRVPRDSGKASIRVKAYRWVIADRSRADGWRPLLWSDVTESFVGMPVPSLTATVGDPGTTATLELVKPGATADDVIENPALLGTLGSVLGEEKAQQLKNVIDRLKEMADDPSNGRRLRHLDNPGDVTYKYTGVKSAGDGPLKAEGGSLFSGDITGLKDDVLFSVRAEDFRTPQRQIVLVPPPSLLTLTKVEYQPAYRHYASPLVPDPANPNGPGVSGGYSLLRDLRQTMPEERLTLTGKQTIFSVPLGTEVVITGVTDKPIVRAFAVPKEGRLPGGKVTIDKDGRELYSADPIPIPVETFEDASGGETVTRGRFTYAFKGEYRITGKKGVHFDLKFVNEDGLESQREVQINVLDDNAPVAEILSDVVRKVGKHYWVTPRAKIPFNPESGVRDDIGLSKVAYVASFKPSDAESVQSARAAVFARNATLPAVGGEIGTVGVAFLDYVFQVRSDQANARKEASFGMRGYVQRDAALARDTFDDVKRKLASPKSQPTAEQKQRVTHVTSLNLETKLRLGSYDPAGTFHKYRWDVEGDFFDIGVIEIAPGRKLAVAADDVQVRYDMQLFVEATDANYDTGPAVRRSEPVDLLVVSETDLLVEIGKDEEKIGTKLDDALKKLALARAKYEFVRSKTENHLPDERDAVAVRSKDAMQDVVKARELVESVARDFRRIERECVFNQLPEKNLALLGGFANRGERIMGEAPSPVSQDEENHLNTGKSEQFPFGTFLTPKSTFPRTEKGMAAAHAVFDGKDQWPTPTSVTSASDELFKLEQEVLRFRQDVGEAIRPNSLKLQLKSILERQDAIARAIREARAEAERIQRDPNPKLDTIGQVLLSKGEAKKLRHGIQWRQFKEDTLTIKVVSSDPVAVIVPAELKLDFERNSIDFEYEVRAGAKDGNYNVTLTPSAGDPIVVQIQVK
jgi:hypothetical protein